MLSARRHTLPDAFVGDDEAEVVHLKLSGEARDDALVAISALREARIAMGKRLDGHLGKAYPRGGQLAALTNGEVEPANRQRVGGRRYAKIYIYAAGELGQFAIGRDRSRLCRFGPLAYEPVPALEMKRQIGLSQIGGEDKGPDQDRFRSPGRVTIHRVPVCSGGLIKRDKHMPEQRMWHLIVG